MDGTQGQARQLFAIVVVGGVCIAGSVILPIAIWLAWPDDGSSTYSTAANVGQLALVLAGVVAAALSGRALILELSLSRTLLPAALAVGCWVLWWVLFVVLGIGDSSV
jgi:hypothetical protein